MTDTRAIQAAEWKMNVSGDLRAVVEAKRQYWSSLDLQARDPETFWLGFQIVDSKLGVRDEDRRCEIVALVNTVSDRRYHESRGDTACNSGTQAVLPHDLRRYGDVRLAQNFKRLAARDRYGMVSERAA